VVGKIANEFSLFSAMSRSVLKEYLSNCNKHIDPDTVHATQVLLSVAKTLPSTL